VKTVNIHEAKTNLSALLAAVLSGDEVIIAKAGRPIARLIPFEAPAKRPIGLYDDLVSVPDDFDEEIPDAFVPYIR
jgi:prevent-host-death family protein